YCFLNYLVLSLGILLVDDNFLVRFVPQRWRSQIELPLSSNAPAKRSEVIEEKGVGLVHAVLRPQFKALKLAIAAVMLTWNFYVTTVQLIWLLVPHLPLPTTPVVMLEPSRIANQYGLFAVMTRGRYEIEFQGSNDGQNWTAYPFRYKPQALNEPPGIYAPYHPRFDWNLWFASLGSWRNNSIVPNTEVRLLSNDSDVLSLFADNPFPGAPPKQVRAVLWQYWFSTMAEKRATGNWWRRQLLGLYAPTVELQADGKIGIIEMPQIVSPEQ
ncbi:MAG TPA: lipase maturation factor family protein, partial [Terriglobales bacterium]|nr:lipase maturation factor family protein [Terriglobales bacterium]